MALGQSLLSEGRARISAILAYTEEWNSIGSLVLCTSFIPVCCTSQRGRGIFARVCCRVLVEVGERQMRRPRSTYRWLVHRVRSRGLHSTHELCWFCFQQLGMRKSFS
jgi:hypothetical protein